MDTPPDGFFVARDRARRIGWALEKALQERRLAWQGDAIGMTSVADDADRTLAALAEDAEESVTAVLEGRIRDRERGFMEIPFAVALTSVAQQLAEAAEAESARRLGRDPKTARARAEAAMSWALARLEAFQTAYDQKTPVLESKTTDLSRVLREVSPGESPPWDRPPPPLRTEPNAAADLLLAIRVALPEADGPWHVAPPAPGQPLRFCRGRSDGAPDLLAVPPSVARAVEVLSFRHPAHVETRARPTADGGVRLEGLTLSLGAPAGAGLEATVEMLAGPEARLSPPAEAAARLLYAAPPTPPGPGPVAVPHERLVALAGLERVLSTAVRDVLGDGRLGAASIRMAAGALPRERTRKAPVRSAVLNALREAFPALPVDRLGPLARSVASGRIRAKDLTLAEAALLLLTLGRASNLAGVRLEACLDLAPLAEADIEALALDLLDVAASREALAGGGGADPAAVMRFEGAVIGALGRLGRLGD